ncbi:MAG: hypothetical protein EXR21_01440 [Flavobacteriaceae bacterium]|nr:hypothetical protein [Flavobacteriaceae bacterium]
MKFTLNRNIFAIVAIATLAACNPITKMSKALKKATYKMSPEVLEVRGDSVDIGFKMTLPKGAITPKGVIKLEPILRYGKDNDQELVLRPYVIKGTKAEDPSANITMGVEGGIITYSDRIAYNPQMKRCTLYIQPNLKIKSYDELLDKCIEIGKDSLGLGTITTSLTYATNEDVSMPDASCTGPILERKATIYYIVDTWDFKPGLVQKAAKTSNPDELKSLVSYLKDKSEYTLSSLRILSSASPDGTYKRNTLLARNRDVTAYNFLKEELKRLGFMEVNDSLIGARTQITEEFDGLRTALEASNLKDKQAMVDIINSSDDPDMKEFKLRKDYMKSYRSVLNYIMPRLRRSEITVVGEKGCKPWFALADAATTNFEGLTADEMLMYGGKIEGISDKEKCFRVFASKYPDDWRGYNNLGAILITQNKHADAKVALEKAQVLNSSNGEVYNNLGICYRNLKMYDKAEENYKKAKSYGVNVNNNMGIINIVRGQYSDAINNFKAAGRGCQYNMALAYTMNGEYSPAQKAIDCMDAKDKDAQTWYLKAVIAARAGNLTEVTTNLKKAIGMDGKLKAIAVEDLEFIKFFKTNEFKSVVGG